MDHKINSGDYWEQRFSTGNWETAGGRCQTRSFALAQISHFCLPKDFSGTLLDFGCGTGDAFPVYRNAFPKATLIGMDISRAAIDLCNKHYGDLAEFRCGSINEVQPVDVIILSNVLEHLPDDVSVVKSLKCKCKKLFVTVPYKESPLCSEHINSYDEHVHFGLDYQYVVFYSRGWSQYGFKKYWYRILFKNIFRKLFSKPCVSRRKQIMYKFV